LRGHLLGALGQGGGFLREVLRLGLDGLLLRQEGLLRLVRRKGLHLSRQFLLALGQRRGLLREAGLLTPLLTALLSGLLAALLSGLLTALLARLLTRFLTGLLPGLLSCFLPALLRAGLLAGRLLSLGGGLLGDLLIEVLRECPEFLSGLGCVLGGLADVRGECVCGILGVAGGLLAQLGLFLPGRRGGLRQLGRLFGHLRLLLLEAAHLRLGDLGGRLVTLRQEGLGSPADVLLLGGQLPRARRLLRRRRLARLLPTGLLLTGRLLCACLLLPGRLLSARLLLPGRLLPARLLLPGRLLPARRLLPGRLLPARLLLPGRLLPARLLLPGRLLSARLLLSGRLLPARLLLPAGLLAGGLLRPGLGALGEGVFGGLLLGDGLGQRPGLDVFGGGGHRLGLVGRDLFA
jgi:hypothetical protein